MMELPKSRNYKKQLPDGRTEEWAEFDPPSKEQRIMERESKRAGEEFIQLLKQKTPAARRISTSSAGASLRDTPLGAPGADGIRKVSGSNIV